MGPNLRLCLVLVSPSLFWYLILVLVLIQRSYL